jgi:hypothetical protein
MFEYYRMSSEKLYFGPEEKIPSGYTRRGSMSEAVKHKQVRWFGVHKVDPRRLEKKTTLTSIDISGRMIPLHADIMVRKKMLLKMYKDGDDPDETDKLRDIYESRVEEYKHLVQLRDKLAAREKAAKERRSAKAEISEPDVPIEVPVEIPKKRGRPKKPAKQEEPEAQEPKKRGRPKKTNRPVGLVQKPKRKGPGRPRKDE